MANLLLEIVEGPGAGKQVPLTDQLEIGRERPAGLILDDQQVSRRHARVSAADGGAIVEDLGSRNGTFVNGNEIHSPTRLGPGDHLLVGVTVLELRTPQQIAARPTAVRPIPPALATPPKTPTYVPPEAVAEAGSGGGASGHVLDPLLDIHTKRRARLAPVAIFVLVVIAVLIFLATALD